LYGKNYLFGDKQLHFIFDLIRKILRGHFYKEKVVLWGDGEQKREIVHVDDFIDTMLKLVATEKNQAFNIGEGQEHSIKEFAQIICNLVDYPFAQIEFDTSCYVGAHSKVLINNKLKKIMPNYQPRQPEQGIREVVKWLKENKKCAGIFQSSEILE
jgi:GDP-L-fucose synthase